jgi:hypothetical protein
MTVGCPDDPSGNSRRVIAAWILSAFLFFLACYFVPQRALGISAIVTESEQKKNS